MVQELAQPLIRRGRLGLLPAAFNPPTSAHLALARAAAEQHALDQVALVLPANLPHKEFDHVPFEQRRDLLVSAVANAPGVTAAVCEGGLFHEIADELLHACGSIEPALIAGRDAAERIVAWDYGDAPSIAEQLTRFELLVASREGSYLPPREIAHRIRNVQLSREWDAVSSSLARRSIASGGEEWRDYVPGPVADAIRRHGLYGHKG